MRNGALIIGQNKNFETGEISDLYIFRIPLRNVFFFQIIQNALYIYFLFLVEYKIKIPFLLLNSFIFNHNTRQVGLINFLRLWMPLGQKFILHICYSIIGFVLIFFSNLL